MAEPVSLSIALTETPKTDFSRDEATISHDNFECVNSDTNRQLFFMKLFHVNLICNFKEKDTFT